jgi:5-formyltetrahydrofolate cyclo-ligase
MKDKKQLRLFFLSKRRELSFERREKAKMDALETLAPLLLSFETVLSFASAPEEIDLWPLNHLLAKEKRLALPKRTLEGLHYYRVENFEQQLRREKWNVLEPIPEKCALFPLKGGEGVLVPAVAFDESHHRLGYGHGEFDHFLEKHPALITFGVGFQEQLSHTPLPTLPHDQKVTFLYLF